MTRPVYVVHIPSLPVCVPSKRSVFSVIGVVQVVVGGTLSAAPVDGTGLGWKKASDNVWPARAEPSTTLPAASIITLQTVIEPDRLLIVQLAAPPFEMATLAQLSVSM